jgi:hypothetical protein
MAERVPLKHGMCAVFIKFQKLRGVYYVCSLATENYSIKNDSPSLKAKVICNLVNGKKTATDQDRSIVTIYMYMWDHTIINKWNGDQLSSVIIWLYCHLFSFQNPMSMIASRCQLLLYAVSVQDSAPYVLCSNQIGRNY